MTAVYLCEGQIKSMVSPNVVLKQAVSSLVVRLGQPQMISKQTGTSGTNINQLPSSPAGKDQREAQCLLICVYY